MNDYLNCHDLLPLLTPYERWFCEAEYGRGLQAYKERIKYVGLEGRGVVLDAGGGIGQWAIALAHSNKEVHVLDLSSQRLLVGKAQSERLGIQNISFQWGSIDELPYPNSSFDALICYSVFMFADGDKAASEFARVLKPGGRLYVQVDLWRWHLIPLMMPSRWWVAIKWVFMRLVKKIISRPDVRLYSVKSFERLFGKSGFTIISSGQDGFASFSVAVADERGRQAFYPTENPGRERLWEICAFRD